MKKLLIYDVGGDLDRVLHEIATAADYRVAGIVGAKPGRADIAHFENVAGLAPADLDGAVFFVVGDTALLNQRRLSAYMEIKRRGLPVVALRSASASIAEGVRLRENVYVDHAARVLPGANVGANTWIMQGSELGANSKTGSSCWIGRHCRVSERAALGKNCTLGDGVTIGPDVVLPAWSTLASGTTLMQSPPTALFVDPLFRAPVHLFGDGARL